mgnify:CR=1 FL=1|tara:strand:+ start:2545 stop:3456 length:912 start_codon:yes stop_codon:yes gene_type:complete
MGKLYHNRFYAMGTRFHALIPGIEETHAERIFYQIKMEVERIESKISRFLPDSDLSRINRLAAKKPVQMDPEMSDILNACHYCWSLTDRAFDSTLRPLMEYWKEDHEDSLNDSDFKNIIDNVGFQHLTLDESDSTVMFDNDQVELDLGGFGKGYALEKVKEMLSDASIDQAFISFGESSILAIGDHPAGDKWRIGMNNYVNPGNTVHEFRVNNGSVSTSSNFFLDDAGRLRNHRHVINPKTGKPHEPFTSVSVSAESPVLAEMLSTAFLVSSDEKINEVMNHYENLEVIRVDYEPGNAIITQF